MSTNRLVMHVAALVILAVLSACGSNEAPSADLAADGRHSQAAAEAKTRDPCSLVTLGEAEAILGVSLTARRANHDARTCEYAPAAGAKMNGFTVTVHWSGGKEALGTLKGAMSVATGLMTSSEMDPSSMMKLEPVPGVGDEAYFNPIAGTAVLLDDTLLEFDIRAMMWRQSRESGRSLWKRLAATALAKL
jgi:hypothetical protein